jgi:molybdate transport system ATP-binding protein
MTTGVEGRFSGRFGAFELDAGFSLPPTGITALSGPSGSGKTSLLRCIAGLTRLPGRLIVDGEVWQDAGAFLPTHRRPVGVVFQEPSLLHHLSVRGNLDYGARRSSAKGASLDEVVDLLGLAPLLARSTTHLSGGERQRVALARALANNPRLLLADEPTGALDTANTQRVLNLLSAIRERRGMTVVVVTYDPTVARHADRVLHMRDGRLVPDDESLRPAEQLSG